MKNFLIIFLLSFYAFSTTSCTKKNEDKNIINTSWSWSQTSDRGETAIETLTFIDDANFKSTVVFQGRTSIFNCTYTLDYPNISVNKLPGVSPPDIAYGTINDDLMTINYRFGDTRVYIKNH